MKTKKARYLICLLLPLSLFSDCSLGQRIMHVSAKHLEGNGIGYNHGYTSLECFVSPTSCFKGSWVPFIDLRGHLFNNGNPAANAGVGARYLGKYSWGMNLYYDYRKTNHFHSNQIGGGLELIGSFWSIDVNGYFPVSSNRTCYSNKSTASTQLVSGGSTVFFSGNNLFFPGNTLTTTTTNTKRYEFAFTGVDANATVQMYERDAVSFELGFGPYYYAGSFKENSFGAKGALRGHFSEFLTIAGIISYDSVFHLRGSGELAINIPFGLRSSKRKLCKPDLCNIPSFVDGRFNRGANRSEIIVMNTKKKTGVTRVIEAGSSEIAINPDTGNPWVFWFVDNTSSSAGTYESPFPTMAQAIAASSQNEVIYVLPGDGTTTGLNAGSTRFTMKDGQYWFGAGTAQTITTQRGSVTIPAMAASMPHFKADDNSFVINMADNCTISGLHIAMNLTTVGSVGNPISTNPAGIGSVYTTNSAATTPPCVNPTIINNTIVCTGNYARGIYIYNATGTILLDNNTVSATLTSGTAGAIESRLILSNLYLSNTTGDFTVTNNTFTGSDNSGTTTGASRGYSMDLVSGGGGVYSILFENNTMGLSKAASEAFFSTRLTHTLTGTVTNNISTDGYQGISFQATDSATGKFAVTNNTVTGHSTSQGSGIRASSTTATTTFYLDIENNTISGIGPNPGSIINAIGVGMNGSPVVPQGTCVRILNNTFGASELISFTGFVRYEPLTGNTNNTPTTFGSPTPISAGGCGTIPEN